ncbi:L7Ae/L30e/S12e/Gadd45 family ribosomal protein [Dehalobacterium formicoaceticum]|uniref:Ribosomal L7Ae/L30e/S12e/Gadd45 family protein n=1 Tax=Dehalobacterium formicoaceticum TaxID=51515 RepID=A0ABT1Y4U7_9FIRM|nr:ribosomal L7Ae/L30e/S12e/Gadd45 family protein [Dehalobacterium formicoaceticum]MCR6545894.1 ribosomal L7Ae/L30e/S12e/Gadd45 family protein [Dehalobacterium formicoaceticum]
MNHQVFTLLGFAQKAGKIVSGETGCTAAIKHKKALLVIFSADAAESTKTQIKFLCRQNKIECREWGSKIDLGNSIGKSPRAVLAVTEKGFASAILKILMSSV